MYTHGMNVRILRNMDGGAGGGAAAAAGSQAAGNQSESGQSGSQGAGSGSAGASSQHTNEYLSKADFEAKWGELQGHLARLTPQERREAAEEKDKGGKPSKLDRPDPSKYDFKNDPKALQKYEDDLDEYRYQIRKEKEASEAAEKTAQERQEKTLRGHQARVIEYKKENPTFDEDVKKAGPVMGEPSVTQAVFSSKESPAIVHRMVKDRALVDELNQLALSGDDYAVHQRVGEIAAEIRAERKALEANAEAAAAKPPRQSFNKGSARANHEKTAEERYREFRS